MAGNVISEQLTCKQRDFFFYRSQLKCKQAANNAELEFKILERWTINKICVGIVNLRTELTEF